MVTGQMKLGLCKKPDHYFFQEHLVLSSTSPDINGQPDQDLTSVLHVYLGPQASIHSSLLAIKYTKLSNLGVHW